MQEVDAAPVQRFASALANSVVSGLPRIVVAVARSWELHSSGHCTSCAYTVAAFGMTAASGTVRERNA